MAAGIIWTHSLSIIRNINLSAFNLVRVTAWNLFRSDKVKTHFILRSVPIRINCTINSNSRQRCYEEQKKCRKSLSGWTFSWPIDGRSNGECSQLCRCAGHQGTTGHSPDVFGVRSDVWRSEDLSSVSCSSSSWFIVNPPPLSSVLTQTDPPKLIIQTHSISKILKNGNDLCLV